MKIAPVSGDMVVKLAIGAAVLGAAWYALTKLQSAGQGIVAAAGSAADAVAQGVNPTSDKNWAYRATNALGNTIASDSDSPGKNADGSWSLGGWIYDVTH